MKPAQQLAEFIDRPVLWFWGHEHRLALYGLHAFKGGIPAYGRCIGHGGMPVDRWPDGKRLRHPDCAPTFADNRRFPNDESLDVGYNGYALLAFEGPSLRVDYKDITGAVVHSERWSRRCDARWPSPLALRSPCTLPPWHPALQLSSRYNIA